MTTHGKPLRVPLVNRYDRSAKRRDPSAKCRTRRTVAKPDKRRERKRPITSSTIGLTRSENALPDDINPSCQSRFGLEEVLPTIYSQDASHDKYTDTMGSNGDCIPPPHGCPHAMQKITDAHLSNSYIRVDPKLRLATYQVPTGKGKVRTCRLDGNDQLLISDVLSFHLQGKLYYRSIGSISDIVGQSPSAVSRMLKRLHELGFLIVTPNANSPSQTNTVALGPATIALFNNKQKGEPLVQPMQPEQVTPADRRERTSAEEVFDEFLLANRQNPRLQ